MSKVAIVDLGTGNLHSVRKAVQHVSVGCAVSVTNNASEIESADHLILPGQGAIGTWFKQLQGQPMLDQAVRNRLSDGPVLGICLGLQALYQSSEENSGTQGLGILSGEVKHFASNSAHKDKSVATDYMKIPHMGWNNVSQRAEHPLWSGIKDQERFYFVHSFYAESANDDHVMGECTYGNRFTAAAGQNNLFATQFHPEKSQQAGLRLLKNFINWNGIL